MTTDATCGVVLGDGILKGSAPVLCSSMIKFRRSCPLLGRTTFLTDEDITWHEHNWDDNESRFLAFTYHDRCFTHPSPLPCCVAAPGLAPPSHRTCVGTWQSSKHLGVPTVYCSVLCSCVCYFVKFGTLRTNIYDVFLFLVPQGPRRWRRVRGIQYARLRCGSQLANSEGWCMGALG